MTDWAAVEAAKHERQVQRARLEMARSSAATIDQPWVQPIIKRLGCAVGDFAYGIDRCEYVQLIALDVAAARLRPRHPCRTTKAGTGKSAQTSAGARRKEV